MHVEIIAEVGECFNGNIETALNMIVEAKKCGCDVVKFQLLDMNEVSPNDPEYDWFASLNIDIDNLRRLIDCANNNDIGILFTPVSVREAEMMKAVGLKNVKIASSFVNKTELITYINDNFDEIYMSTGMAELVEIDNALKHLYRPEKVKLLHCISEYPTGPLLEQRGLKALDEKDVHLNMMNILINRYPNYIVGYSDHTDDIFVPEVAAAMGAKLIEKHFTLDRATPIYHYEHGLKYMGTDHVLSIEPKQMKKMVDNIRRIEIIQGDDKWNRSNGEKILINFLRGRYIDRN